MIIVKANEIFEETPYEYIISIPHLTWYGVLLQECGADNYTKINKANITPPQLYMIFFYAKAAIHIIL